jgi:hypothetical protein
VKQIIEWGPILEARSVKWICIGLVGVLLAFGLWPLDFWPKNHVEWLRAEKGLRFTGKSVMHERTVGGYVSSVGPPAKRDSKKRGFTIEIFSKASSAGLRERRRKILIARKKWPSISSMKGQGTGFGMLSVRLHLS